jgi:nascent polypeptide-associated complex subunit alpha
MEDMNSQAQMNAAQQLSGAGGGGGGAGRGDVSPPPGSGVGAADDDDDDIPDLEAAEDETAAPDPGVDQKDVDLVVSQVRRLSLSSISAIGGCQ